MLWPLALRSRRGHALQRTPHARDATRRAHIHAPFVCTQSGIVEAIIQGSYPYHAPERRADDAISSNLAQRRSQRLSVVRNSGQPVSMHAHTPTCSPAAAELTHPPNCEAAPGIGCIRHPTADHRNLFPWGTATAQATHREPRQIIRASVVGRVETACNGPRLLQIAGTSQGCFVYT